jgi:hypothetical protein
MSVSIERLLLVCPSCWTAAFPLRKAPDTRSVHSYVDCFVCEQARGLIYVRATVSFAPNTPEAGVSRGG